MKEELEELHPLPHCYVISQNGFNCLETPKHRTSINKVTMFFCEKCWNNLAEQKAYGNYLASLALENEEKMTFVL